MKIKSFEVPNTDTHRTPEAFETEFRAVNEYDLRRAGIGLVFKHSITMPRRVPVALCNGILVIEVSCVQGVIRRIRANGKSVKGNTINPI